MKRITVMDTNLTFVEKLLERTITEQIIIHHVGGTNRDVAAAEIHQWHLDKGWAGIGYHFVIRKDGSVERGRPQDTVGSHCYRHNSRSIGVNVVGDFRDVHPADVQIEALGGLLADLCEQYGLQPMSRAIVGHRDLGVTECPGENLYRCLKRIREHVSILLNI